MMGVRTVFPNTGWRLAFSLVIIGGCLTSAILAADLIVVDRLGNPIAHINNDGEKIAFPPSLESGQEAMGFVADAPTDPPERELSGTAVGEFIPVNGCVDMVYNDLDGILYISSSNCILRYRVSLQNFLAPIVVGDSLGGVDISPDGKRLAVASRTRSATESWIYLVDLKTLEVRQVLFPLAFYEGGTYTVAFGVDGSVWVTSTFEGSGWVPLRRYDPATSNITTLASVRQNSMLTASADREVIAYEQSNISSGPAGKYDVRTRNLLGTVQTGWFTYEVGVSRDGSQLAVPTYGGTFIYDNAGNDVTNLGVYAGSQPVGVVYHPLRDEVFFAWAGTTEVRHYDTRSFELIDSYDVGSAFAHPGNNGFRDGRLRISASGTELFVKIGGGIRHIPIGTPIPEYRYLVVEGVPERHGQPSIPYGINWVANGSTLTNSVEADVEESLMRYHCSGWTGSGSVPAEGQTNRLVCQVSADSSLTWQWAPTQAYLSIEVVGGGTVNASNGWRPYGATIELAASAGPGNTFNRWDGDVPDAPQRDPTLWLTMDRARTVYAVFGPPDSGEGVLSGDWPTYGNGPAHAGHVPGSLSYNVFTQKWVCAVTGRLNQVAVGGGKIFVTARADTKAITGLFMEALDEQTGNRVWRYDFAKGFSINPPTYDSAFVYVQRCNHSGDTHLWCFNVNTGSNVWRTGHSAQWEEYMAPTIADGKIWVNGGYDGGLYGFNQSSGERLFFQRALAQYDDWTPMYHEGNLYSWVAGHFRQHDPASGTIVWDLNLGGNWPSWGDMDRTVAATDHVAFCTGNASELYAIDLVNTQLAWRAAGAYSGTPAAANGVVYAIRGTAVDARSIADGSLLGTYTTDRSLSGAIIVTDDALIVGGADKTFVFDLPSFALRQTLPHGGWLSLANNVLYIAQSNGELYAFKTVPSAVQLIVRSNAGPFGSPSPYGYGTNKVLLGAGFVEQVQSPSYLSGSSRYVCTGWSGAGDVPSSGTNTAVELSLATDSILTWKWQAEHYVRIMGTNGTVAGMPDGWLPEGFVYGVFPSNDYGYAFDHWEINGTNAGSVVPMRITISGPLTIEPLFVPVFVDVTADVLASLGSWTFNPQSGTFWGTLTLSNSASGRKALIEPFWYLVASNQNQRLMHPDGREVTTGYPYRDITSQVLARLPLVGDGDLLLDPGESVEVTNIEFYSRFRTLPTGTVWAVWADPPGETVPRTALVETDGDGMPDDWEIRYRLLNKNNPFDAALDSDGDGFSNREEYEADTNPEDANSCLRILDFALSGETISLVWQGGVLATQCVESSVDLRTWKLVRRLDPPGMSTNSIQLPNSERGMFFRIRSTGRRSL